jgi:hypothetical protein
MKAAGAIVVRRPFEDDAAHPDAARYRPATFSLLPR